MRPLPTLASVIAKLTSLGVMLPQGRVFLDEYGDSPELSRSLLALIRGGRKRAGKSLLWCHEAENDPVPAVGDIAVVLDDAHEPAMVTIVASVNVMPFDRVDAAYAAIEGEGDGSLAYWRAGHWKFFTRECERLGWNPHPAMPVVCVVFDVLHVL